MPISVQVKINQEEIGVVYIARMEFLKGDNDYHQYSAVLQRGLIRRRVNFDQGVRFLHVHKDGAMICVRRALEALENE